jgi:secreted trypsin-like serine protease
MAARSLLLLLLLLTACAGHVEQGDLSVVHSCIVGGDLEPTQVALDANQRASVVAVFEPALGVMCSAVVIADGTVLTAKHCLSANRTTFDDVELVFGPDAYASRIVGHPTSVTLHPGADAALLRFEAASLGDAWRSTPMALFGGAIDRSLVGTPVEIAGFGQAEDSEGQLKFARQDVVAVDPATITVNSGADVGACFGDSGGPVLIGTSAGPAVLGILAWGPDDCRGGDHYVRADLLADLTGGDCSR